MNNFVRKKCFCSSFFLLLLLQRVVLNWIELQAISVGFKFYVHEMNFKISKNDGLLCACALVPIARHYTLCVCVRVELTMMHSLAQGRCFAFQNWRTRCFYISSYVQVCHLTFLLREYFKISLENLSLQTIIKRVALLCRHVAFKLNNGLVF